MLGCNNNDLLMDKVDPKYHLFCQVWSELLHKDTLSPYKYSLMNSISCLEELTTILHLRLDGITSSDEDIKDCSHEAARLLAKDPVPRKYHAGVFEALTRNNGNIKDDKNISENYQKRARLYLAEYSLAALKPGYLAKILTELEEAINSGSQENITVCTECLISYCVYLGWSPAALYYSIRILHNSGTWEDFKSFIAGGRQNYKVYFPLRTEDNVRREQDRTSIHSVNLREITSMDFPIIDSARLVRNFHDIPGHDKFEKGQDYIEISAEAFDPYSASSAAVRKISGTLNLLAFYGRIKAWNIRGALWGVFDTQSRELSWISEDDIVYTYDYRPIDTRSKTYLSAKSIVKQDSQNDITRRLVSVMNYVNMGKRSYSFEERFINLWVGLESFCRSDVYSSIILNVLEPVSAVMCRRYIYRLFYNFIADCRRCGEDIIGSYGSSVEDVISALRDENIYPILETRCSVNDLLKIRCREMRSLAVSKLAAAEKVTSYHTQIRRQLGRLYRLRNSIAHNAETYTSNYLSTCTNQLDECLKVFIDEVITYSDSRQGLGLKCLFEMLKDNYAIFEEEVMILTSKKTSKTPSQKMDEFTQTGIMNFI
ncbi:MAG: hypothetical protein II954_08070 [Synergistaceae bacterium]|nr:hypothetical protein [Synergistaceae bacterium]